MSDTLVLNYDTAHTYVERTKKARWDGWDIVLFSPGEYGWNNPRGAFRNGQWGTEQRIAPNSRGLWVVKQPKRKANA